MRMRLSADSDIDSRVLTVATRLLVCGALLSGVGLLLPLLSGGPLVLDEHVAYWIAGPENPSTLLDRSLSVAATPPLSFWLQRVVLAAAGESEIAFRAPSALGYLLAIGVTFLLGRELLGSYAGALAALVFAWHPGVLDEVRIARPYGATVLFGALAFWITVRWKQRPGSLWWAIGWIGANAALLWTHYVNLPAIVLQFLVLTGIPYVFPPTDGPSWKRLFVAVLVLLGISARLGPSMLRIWEWSPFLNFMKTESSVTQVLGALWWAGLPAGWLLAMLCSVRGSRAGHALRLPGGLRWLIVWGLLPVLGLAVMSRGDFTTLANPRYQIVYTVPAACLIAALLTRRTTPFAGFLGCVTAVGVAWFAAGHLPWELERAHPQRAREWEEIADMLEELGEGGEPLLVQSGLIESSLVPGLYRDPLFMDYVACRAGRFYLKTPHRRYGLPFFWDNNPGLEAFFRELAEETCATSQPVIWVAAATDTDLNRSSLEGADSLLRRNGYAVELTRELEFSMLVRYRCVRSSGSQN